jgi:replication factor C small subunit
MRDEFLYIEKYRPRTVEECILPEKLKSRFRAMVEVGQFQNMLLFGSAGTGKTTVAKALCDDVESQYLFINASKENGIDTLRTKITNFVSTVSMINNNRKTVILDEADNMSPALQAGLKSFIEEYSSNAGFILTCNHRNKVIEPLQSRLLNIEFNLEEDKQKMMVAYMKRIRFILEEEGIEYNPEVLAELIKHFFPDLRRILNELHGYANEGKIDTGILAHLHETDVRFILDLLKEKDFATARSYFHEHADGINTTVFVRDMYDALPDYFEGENYLNAVLVLDDFDTKSYTTANKLVSIVAMCIRLIIECDFK